MEKPVHSACRPTSYHVIDRPSELGGHDGQGLALAVFFLEAGQIRLARRRVAQAQARRFSEGPREIRLADRCAGGTLPLPGCCLGTRDQAARGHAILDPWEAGDGMHLLQEYEPADLAKARDRLEPGQGGGIMLFGRGDHGSLHVPQSLVIIVNQGEVYLDALVERGIGTSLGRTSLRLPAAGERGR